MLVGAGSAIGDEVTGALDGCGVVTAGELEGDAFVVPLEVNAGEWVGAAELGCFQCHDEAAIGEWSVMPRIAHAV